MPIQFLSEKLSEVEPNRRLWASFLLVFLRDIIPKYHTKFINTKMHEEYRRYPYSLFKSEMMTFQFEIACHALDLHVDYVRRELERVYWLKIDEVNLDWHKRQYPRGGTSVIFQMGSSGGSQ